MRTRPRGMISQAHSAWLLFVLHLRSSSDNCGQREARKDEHGVIEVIMNKMLAIRVRSYAALYAPFLYCCRGLPKLDFLQDVNATELHRLPSFACATCSIHSPDHVPLALASFVLIATGVFFGARSYRNHLSDR